MLKKLLKMIIIFAVITGMVYLFYITIMMPRGYKDTSLLVEDYIANLDSENACAEYFNPETKDVCTTFQASLEGETITISDEVTVDGDLLVTLSVNDNQETFLFTFISVEESGIRAFFNSSYYYIDTIQ